MSSFKLFFESKNILTELPNQPARVVLPGGVLSIIDNKYSEDNSYNIIAADLKDYITRIVSQLESKGKEVRLDSFLRKSSDPVKGDIITFNLEVRRYNPEQLPIVFRKRQVEFTRYKVIAWLDYVKKLPMFSLKLGKYDFFKNTPGRKGVWGDKNIQQYITPKINSHIVFLEKAGFVPKDVYMVKLFEKVPVSFYITLEKDGKPYVYCRKYTPGADMSYTMLYSQNTRKNMYHLEIREPYSDSVDIAYSLYGNTYYKKGTDVKHRVDGPAVIKKNKKGLDIIKYFINGIEYTKEEFDQYTKDLNKDEAEMLGDLGQTFE